MGKTAEPQEHVTVTIDPRTTKVNLGILVSIVGASVLAYSQVSDLKFGIERVTHNWNAMTETLRSVTQSLDRQASSIVDYAIRQVRVEDRVKAIEKRLDAVERGG